MSFHNLPTVRRDSRPLIGNWWGTAVAALLVLNCNRAVSGDQSLADWVPSTTVAYVLASDVQSLDARWKASYLGRFWHDPKMEPFRENRRAARGIGGDESVAWYGLTWDDLQKVAGGPAALAVAPAGEDVIGFLLLVDVNERRDAAQAARDNLVASMQAAGAAKRMEDLQGVSVTALNLESGEADKPAIQRYCFLDDRLLIISDRRPLIEQVLSLRGGSGQKSLAQTTEYQAVSARASQAAGDRTVDLSWYMTPIQYTDLLVAAGVSQPNENWQLMRTLGFDVFQAVGGVVCVTKGERELETFTVIHAPNALQKAAQWFSLRPLGDINLPDWIPEDVASVTQWSWDHAAAFAGYGHWFDAKYAEGEEGVFDDVLLDILEESDGPQVDVRKDLIEQFVAPTTVATFTSQAEDSVTDIRTVTTLVKDPTTVGRAVQRMLEGDPDVVSEQLGGSTAWVFRDLERVEEESGAQEPASMLGPDLSRVAVLVAKGALITASDIAILKRLMGDELAPVNQLPEFQRVAKEIKQRAGKELVGWRFSQPHRGWRSWYESMRAGNPPDAGSMSGVLLGLLLPSSSNEVGGTSSSTSVDYTLLPEFQQIQQFLLPMGFWAEATDSGWLIVGFAHQPSSDESEQQR